jgi:integrase/recombinase XerC
VVENTRPSPAAELERAASEIAAELHRRQQLSEQSEPRVFGLFERFSRFVDQAFGVTSLRDVSVDHVEAFVRASNGSTSAPPSAATMRLRRSTLRLLFRTAREIGLLEGDPTVDLALPPRTNNAPRPLNDDEVDECRRVCLHDLTSTRLSVAWALGEATARTSEIPHITLADVDLERRRIWTHGSSKTDARWGELTDWGTTQVARHLKAAGALTDSTAIAYVGSGNVESRRSFSSQAVRETMQRAGLTSDPSVKPASLAAWAGRRVLSDTGRIERVALALGVHSLDAAARAIGWNWLSDSKWT